MKAIIEKGSLETLVKEGNTVYLEKREVIYFLGIKIYQWIIDTANQSLIEKFSPKSTNQIGFKQNDEN